MSASRVATGDIEPARFVSIDETSAEPKSIRQSVGSELPHGISANAAKDALEASTVAAADGDHLEIFTEGEECLLEIGGVVTEGDLLMPDNLGRGIASTGTAEDATAAVALQSGAASGEKIQVMVQTHRGA